MISCIYLYRKVFSKRYFVVLLNRWLMIYLSLLGTWQTYVVKDHSVWHKIDKGSPMEYAATITVNPLTALRMLEDYVTLNSGIAISISLLQLHFYGFHWFIWVWAGDSVAQNGATSIVGQCVIQIARSRGICSINIIRDRYCIRNSSVLFWPYICC